MARDIKEGNQCLFMIFVGANFTVFLSSLGMLACAIYMFVVLDPNNFINFYVLGISLALLMLTLCSFKLRKSIHFLGLYIFIKFLMFTAVLIASFVLMFNKTAVSTWAKEAINKQFQDSDHSQTIEEIT